MRRDLLARFISHDDECDIYTKETRMKSCKEAVETLAEIGSSFTKRSRTAQGTKALGGSTKA